MNSSTKADVAETEMEALKRRSRWLTEYSQNFHSQTGEDGILGKALDMLPERNQWCVEFGAWDGKHLSNTFHLVEEGYRVVLIEGDAEKYRQLCADYPFKERGTFVNAFVGWTEKDGLDSILTGLPIPLDFDLLSIDIDGNDYHVWRAVEKYRPKLVLIEFNPTASNRMDYVQPADPRINRSSSPAAVVRLGKEKGYELVSVIGPNLLLVDKRFYDLFEIPDNSLAVMRDEDEVTTLFLGFDGCVFQDGPGELRWHGIKVKLKQPLPKILQRYPPAYSKLERVLFRVFKRIFG
jgi:hypothetical protein